MLTSPEQATAQSTYDDIWRFAEWYRNDGNETVQSVLLSGGFQYEFAAVGADQGRASDVFALTVGKQGVPFTMDGSTSSKELLTIDRSNLRKQMDRIPVTVLQRMLDACDRPGRPDFRSLCLQECRVTVSSRIISDDSPIRDAIATDAAYARQRRYARTRRRWGAYWL